MADTREPPASVITEEMRAAIGVESEPIVVEVDKAACRLFARALGYSDLLYYDEDFAKAKGYRSILAPPCFLGQPVFGPDRSDPFWGSYFRFRAYKRLLNGGTDVEYFDTICAGDELTLTSKLADLRERVGSLGPMLITVTEWTYRNHEGKLVAILRGTGIQY